MRGRLFLSVVILIVVGLVAAACGNDDDDDGAAEETSTEEASEPTEDASDGSGSAADLVPADIAESGTLTVGTAIGNPPWAFAVEGQDDPDGFDMELIRALGDELGLDVQIEVAEFPTLIPSLESGRYDALISSLTVREERTEVIDLLAYIQIATGVLVPAGNPEGLTGLGDACGLSVGVAQGSANEVPVLEAQEACGDDPINIVRTQGNDFVALESGQVDLMVLDAAGALFTETERPDTFEALGEVYGAGLAGIGTNKDQAALSQALQQALLNLIEAGTYQGLLEEWNLVEIGFEGAEINPDTGG